MSAWLEIHTALSLRVDATEAYRLMHAYRDEELRKHAEQSVDTAEAYDGELAMLRSLVRTLRVVARPDADEVDVAEVQRLLHHHLADEQAAREQGKSSRPADATPREAARERRLEQLLGTMRTHGGKWTTSTLQTVRRSTGEPAQRGTARRDLAELARRGHLHQHGAGDGRYYTLKRRTDGA